MNSKDKGNIGEAIAIAEFIKREIQVSIPFGDNARYDLIAEFNNKLNKIQVKYCNQKIKNNSIPCPCVSSTNHTTNKRYISYKNDIDYFIFYLAEWDEILIVPIEEIGDQKTITFRKTVPPSSQNYHLVQDYTFAKFFNDEIEKTIEKEEEIEEEEEENTFPILKITKPNIVNTNKKINKCIDCGIGISSGATRCVNCTNKAKRVPLEDMPVTREELKNLIRTTPFVKIGEKFALTDNAIRKWCDKFNLPRKVKDIQKYSDEEWASI